MSKGLDSFKLFKFEESLFKFPHLLVMTQPPA